MKCIGEVLTWEKRTYDFPDGNGPPNYYRQFGRMNGPNSWAWIMGVRVCVIERQNRTTWDGSEKPIFCARISLTGHGLRSLTTSTGRDTPEVALADLITLLWKLRWLNKHRRVSECIAVTDGSMIGGGNRRVPCKIAGFTSDNQDWSSLDVSVEMKPYNTGYNRGSDAERAQTAEAEARAILLQSFDNLMELLGQLELLIEFDDSVTPLQP